MLYRLYDLYSPEVNQGEILSKILLYKLAHIKKKGREYMIMILFLSRISCNQRRSDTPQFVTTGMDIRGHHFTDSHCYLQYSQ
jgi:hypothetical protein